MLIEEYLALIIDTIGYGFMIGAIIGLILCM